MQQQWRRSGKKERDDETQFTSKFVGKLVWVPVVQFCNISFPVMHLMPYYAGGKRKEAMKLSLPAHLLENQFGSQLFSFVIFISFPVTHLMPYYAGKKERDDETQFTIKFVGKLVLVPVIQFCKISFPVTHLMPYYAKTGRRRPLIA